jgi:hypothetical protein
MATLRLAEVLQRAEGASGWQIETHRRMTRNISSRGAHLQLTVELAHLRQIRSMLHSSSARAVGNTMLAKLLVAAAGCSLLVLPLSAAARACKLLLLCLEPKPGLVATARRWSAELRLQLWTHCDMSINLPSVCRR